MNDFALMLGVVVDLMKVPFTIFGVQLSFWSIMIWIMVASIIAWAVVRFLNDD